MNRPVAILFCVLLLGCAGAAHAQNLITNGGFETAPAAGSDNYPSSPAYYAETTGTTQYTPAGTDWTFGLDTTGTLTARVEWFTATQKEIWDHPPSATGGTYAVELNSDSSTNHLYCQQALTLTSGKSYTLTLDIAPELPVQTLTPYPSVVVTLRNGAALTSTALSTFTFTVTGTGWQTVTTTFTAPSGVSIIRFEDSASSGQPQDNITLDNISVTATTPEPKTLWSAAFILLGVCAMERKRLRGAFRHARPFRLKPDGLV